MKIEDIYHLIELASENPKLPPRILYHSTDGIDGEHFLTLLHCALTYQPVPPETRDHLREVVEAAIPNIEGDINDGGIL